MASHHRQHLKHYLSEHKVGRTGSVTTSTSRKSSGLEARSAVSRRYLGCSQQGGQQERSSYLQRPIGKATIYSLPDELLLKIFSYLQAGDLLTAARVCKWWWPLANDNLLWNAIFEKYGHLEGATRGSGGEHQPSSQWKSLCIRYCSEKRNKKALKLLKKISPFTGLYSHTDKAVKVAGIYFQLELVDLHQTAHTLLSRDVFFHPMATCARWYDLEMAPLKKIKKVQIYSCNPLFFNKDGSALKNSPYQRSLLLSQDLDWGQWVSTNKPLCSDEMVNVYTLPQGLLLATWKNDGELAFVCCGLHHHELVRRCLYGTSLEPFKMKQHKVIKDDIDSHYGLHDYQCTVELHTLRRCIWSQQFTNLCCKKDAVGSGYIVLSLIRQDFQTDSVILQEKLQFPWKTDAFKGIVENLVWLDITVLDERQEPFWCVSSSAKVAGKRQEDNYNFDYTNRDVLQLSYTDNRAKLVMKLSQTEDNEYFITGLDLMLSLDAVNEWFGTNYR